MNNIEQFYLLIIIVSFGAGITFGRYVKRSIYNNKIDYINEDTSKLEEEIKTLKAKVTSLQNTNKRLRLMLKKRNNG